MTREFIFEYIYFKVAVAPEQGQKIYIPQCCDLYQVNELTHDELMHILSGHQLLQ